jgi:hypothetical protein
VGSVTSFDVNKAIQRSLTKACARHGLGLYIYAGEDLPEAETQTANRPADAATQKAGAVYEKSIIEMCAKTGTDTGKLCEYFKVDTLADLTTVQAIDAMKILEKKEKAK